METSNRYEIREVVIQRSLQVFDTEKGQISGRTRYSTSLLITDLGMQDCRIHLAHGELNQEINTSILRYLRNLGFKWAQLEVPSGSPATSLGKKIKTRSGFDRYVVDLTQEA